jgi:hypothetical protein
MPAAVMLVVVTAEVDVVVDIEVGIAVDMVAVIMSHRQ